MVKMMKNLNVVKYLSFFCLCIFFSACGGGGGGDATTSGSSSTVSSSPVINSGGSDGTLSGTVTVEWSYPTGTDVEGFRLYVYDDAGLQIQTFDPISSDGPNDLDVTFDASQLGTDGSESFYFVVEAYRGTDIARSEVVCYTPDGGMNTCN